MIEESLPKDVKKQLNDHNQVAKKMFSHNKMINGCALTYDTSFGINSNAVNNLTQIVDESNYLNNLGYIISLTGNIIVVKDLIDRS